MLSQPNIVPIVQLPISSQKGKAGNNKSVKTGNSFSLSPMHERYRVFKETYNNSREDLKSKIRLTRDNVANRILYAFYNKFYTLELKRWGDKNPELLPNLYLNNLDLIERVGVEAKSTAWRAMSFLCKVDLGEGRGVLMRKIFHGFYQDYTILINPWILTGQIIENWGTETEKKWQKPQNLENQNQSPLLPLVANCNPPFIKGTMLKHNTTTSPCGKADNFTVIQEQETGTNEESQPANINPYLKRYLEGQQAQNNTQTAGGVENDISPRSEQIKGKYFGKPSSTEKVQSSENTAQNVDNAVEKPKNGEIRAKSLELTVELYRYAMPILYPKHRESCKTQQKLILNTIWLNWFQPYVQNPNCTTLFLDKLFEDLKELVVMTREELDNKPDSYIHANPAVFFDRTFAHGLFRAYDRFRKNKLNKDRKVLRAAEKSVKTGKVPRNIKNIHSMIDLIAYWKANIERCTVNKQMILKAFNLFLTNPKNLSKNGLKL
ncbi:hypothetical protein [Arcicella rosea]|uniref:Uncharacterized protein n=1 Tax=Arcicella rosea TaxID=502909 RepID=A0A841EI67_9BACT|nr:hypothetical protein [Arcicella rosea]MBB6003897.1 hypothetical protein [Arcicella rosea]